MSWTQENTAIPENRCPCRGHFVLGGVSSCLPSEDSLEAARRNKHGATGSSSSWGSSGT